MSEDIKNCGHCESTKISIRSDVIAERHYAECSECKFSTGRWRTRAFY